MVSSVSYWDPDTWDPSPGHRDWDGVTETKAYQEITLVKDKEEEMEDKAERAFRQQCGSNTWEKKEGGRGSIGYE